MKEKTVSEHLRDNIISEVDKENRPQRLHSDNRRQEQTEAARWVRINQQARQKKIPTSERQGD
jgi:hypothetical protein